MKNMKLIHSLLLIALCMSLGATKSYAQGFASLAQLARARDL